MLFYDINIELKQFAAGRDLKLERIAVLTDPLTLVDTLGSVSRAHETSLCRVS